MLSTIHSSPQTEVHLINYPSNMRSITDTSDIVDTTNMSFGFLFAAENVWWKGNKIN